MKEMDYDQLFEIKDLTKNWYWLTNRRNWFVNNNEKFLDEIICTTIADLKIFNFILWDNKFFGGKVEYCMNTKKD